MDTVLERLYTKPLLELCTNYRVSTSVAILYIQLMISLKAQQLYLAFYFA